jgi:hypothetical protein
MLPGTVHDRGRLLWLMASYVLASPFIPAANLLAHTYWNVAQSYLLAGAFILLALLSTQHAAAAAAVHDRGLPEPEGYRSGRAA